MQASVAFLTGALILQMAEFVVNLLIEMPNFGTIYYRYIYPIPLASLPKILGHGIILVVSLSGLIWVVSKQPKRDDDILDDL